MITKLKYVGIPTADLLDIYTMYIRSRLEYCAVVWHSTLTLEQSNDIERVQKLSLKIIMGADYKDYEHALEISGLDKLSERREARCLKFGLKSLLHPNHHKLFPVNPHVLSNISLPNKEHFHVNWARTESYRISAVPHIQRILNTYVKNQKK